MSAHHHDADAYHATTWRDRLDALLLERMKAPFAWGTNDCCIFAADAALAVTGIDFAVDERGSYATAASAAARISVLGSLSEIADRAGVRIAPALAGVGDIGLILVNGRETLGVCAGHCWLSPSELGLVGTDIGAAITAWRLNHG